MSLARCDLPQPNGKPCGRIISTEFPVHACRPAEPASINGPRDASTDVPTPRRDQAHADLVEVAGRWLRGTMRCGVVLTDAYGAHERPDAIGWKRAGRMSVLVECKTTRRDFRKDASKVHRKFGGMGQVRYYLTPRGLLLPRDLPDGWGLLEFTPGARLRYTVRVPEPERYDPDRTARELPLFYSALWKVQNPDLAPKENP